MELRGLEPLVDQERCRFTCGFVFGLDGVKTRPEFPKPAFTGPEFPKPTLPRPSFTSRAKFMQRANDARAYQIYIEIAAVVTLGLLYFAAGVLTLTMKRCAARVAIARLAVDVIGRLVMVDTGLYPGTGPGVISSGSMGSQAARGKSRGGRAALRDIGRLAAGIQPMTVRYTPTRATITVPTCHQGETPTALLPKDR